MSATKRSTVYLESDLHRAVKLKAAESDRSISDIINEAVRLLLAEDAEDLQALRSRVAEPTVSYESLLAEMRDQDLL
jgi:Arc/MetJ-type ribon-helix-helix transcriptional regulator